MLIAIIGENCTGKSRLAEKINEIFKVKIYSGKDYLRLEKSPSLALEKFKDILLEAVTKDDVIYIISEKEHLSLLPEGAFKIVMTADLETIKNRFRNRMRGNLPLPVEKMLESKHGIYDNYPCDIKLNGNEEIEKVLEALKEKMYA